jgi:LysM domain
MKNGIALLICLFSVITGKTQNSQLTIEGSTGKFYLGHTVVAKENWYSIGRLFNLPPHDIASYNGMNFDKPLDVNTVIKIPLTASNFDQKQLKSGGESLIPIYHLVADKEWAFRISSIYNDVPVTSLEKWNKLKRDDIKPGIQIIVGFLKVKTDLSPLAIGISSNPVTAGISSEPSNKAAVKPTDVPAQTVSKQPVANPTGTAIQTSTKTVAATNAGGAAVPANTSTGGTIPVSNSSERVNNYASTHSNGGFFSVDYSSGGKTASGLAGTFKSTSGWSDGKYYALMNSIAVGTIIRVSGTNGKTIYAKVLGQLPEMKESNGLLIRISNAASAELGLGEGKFPVEVNY